MRPYVFILFLVVFCAFGASAQTFTFECKCEHLIGTQCDICPSTGALSRSFNGLLIFRNGSPYRWIDEPYTIRALPNQSAQFIEQIPNPESITIALNQTPFSTLGGFIDSTLCQCNQTVSGGLDTIVVDTPIIGNGTPLNPVTIGQFGADTTMFLNWNGQYWYPAKVAFTDLQNDLPYFINDEAAITGGLTVGETYLLAAGNTFALPIGLYKVVIGCGYDCALATRFYPNDASASSNGIPNGREYALDENNKWGILYGFIKAIPADLPADTLECNTPSLPFYSSDPTAIIGGLADGDFYTVSASNVYGAPHGMERIVSTTASTTADAPNCCEDATLPYYANDEAAISGGLSSGYFYYLSQNNTLGYPHGSKKVIP